jgi:outer membrane receptor protein involved in Fe transport
MSCSCLSETVRGASRRRTLLLALALLPPTLAAQTESDPDAPGRGRAISDLDPVVVTATRTAETVDATLAPVSVITRAEIERTQAQSTLDLLRGLPGVVLSNAADPVASRSSICAVPIRIRCCSWWTASRSAPPPRARPSFSTCR